VAVADTVATLEGAEKRYGNALLADKGAVALLPGAAILHLVGSESQEDAKPSRFQK
jgi:hypothetical protein